MMARPTVEKPDFWCEEWYKKQKSKGFQDWEIADQLYISICLFNKWKKELNIKKWKYTFSCAGRYKKVK